MAKSKRGRALFDLLDDDGQEIADLLTQERRGARTSARGVEPKTKRSEPSGAKALRLAEPVVSEEDQVRWLRLDGRRIRLTLTSVTAALVLFGALVLLAVAFKIGDRTGFTDGVAQGFEKGRASFAAETLSEIDLARTQAPATQLIEDLYALPAEAEVAQSLGTPPSAKPEWIEGSAAKAPPVSARERALPPRTAKARAVVQVNLPSCFIANSIL